MFVYENSTIGKWWSLIISKTLLMLDCIRYYQIIPFYTSNDNSIYNINSIILFLYSFKCWFQYWCYITYSVFLYFDTSLSHCSSNWGITLSLASLGLRSNRSSSVKSFLNALMIKLQAGAQDHVCDSVYIYMYIDIYIKI